jgi:N-acetylmuramoyl-L-alanine amidase
LKQTVPQKGLTPYTRFRLKRAWQVLVIVLVNLMILSAFASPGQLLDGFKTGEAVYTLSKLGSRGDEVRRIQQKLKSLGLYTGTVDGVYGANTQKAVRQFQKNVGITPDGIAGSKTLLYLGLAEGSASSSSGGFSASDRSLLARVISGEARGEPYIGQVAVGAVVLNRVEHASFPNTVSGVVYQAGAFSAVRDANWSQPVSASAQKAAQDAINGWDPSGGAIYYYNPAKTSNAWIRTRPVVTQIGKHLFCK